MWFVYILLCSDNSLYTGATNDLDGRFKKHQIGKGGSYTRSHKPIRVMYKEKFITKSEALRREAEIKSWPRTKKIKSLRLE